MSILRVLNGKNKYKNIDAKNNLISYMLNPYKAVHGYVGGVGVSPECPAQSMELVSETFHKTDGVQLRHYVLSFKPCELSDPQKANQIACEVAAYIGREYQIVFAVHENTEHIHIHFAANSVSYISGNRYRGTRKEFFTLKNAIRHILEKYGIYRLEYISNKEPECCSTPAFRFYFLRLVWVQMYSMTDSLGIRHVRPLR